MSGLTKSLLNASPGKPPLLDNDVFDHLTTNEGNNIMYSNLNKPNPQEETSYVIFLHGFRKTNPGWTH